MRIFSVVFDVRVITLKPRVDWWLYKVLLMGLVGRNIGLLFGWGGLVTGLDCGVWLGVKIR